MRPYVSGQWAAAALQASNNSQLMDKVRLILCVIPEVCTVLPILIHSWSPGAFAASHIGSREVISFWHPFVSTALHVAEPQCWHAAANCNSPLGLMDKASDF